MFYSLPYFSHWTNNQIKKLVLCFNVKEFKRNQIVYQQDQEANTIYIVKSGEFRAIRFNKEEKVENYKSLINKIDVK